MTHTTPFQAISSQPEIRAFIFWTLATTVQVILLFTTGKLSLISFGLIQAVIIVVTRILAAGRGYEKEFKKLVEQQTLKGKTVLMIGCTSGIGVVTVRKLASLGPKNLILGVRGLERAQKLAKEISQDPVTPKGVNVSGYDLDISSLHSIQQFAIKVKSDFQSINLLVDNAGMLQGPDVQKYKSTSEGLDPTFATNCIGPFYLVELLIPLLTKEKSTRVVIVGSTGHYYFAQNGINYDLITKSENDVRGNPKQFDNTMLYGQSKLGNIFHVRELNRRYRKEHDLKAYVLQPGTIDTQLNRSFPTLFLWIYSAVLKVIGKTVEQGTQTTLYCALSDDAVPGEFHQDCRVGYASNISFDQQKAEEFWRKMESLIQEKTKTK